MQEVTQSKSLEQQTLRLRVLYNMFIKIADKAAQKLYFKDAEVFWCLMWYFNKATKVRIMAKVDQETQREVKESGGSWYEWRREGAGRKMARVELRREEAVSGQEKNGGEEFKSKEER